MMPPIFNRNFIFGSLQLLIIFIVGVFVESVSSKEILFVGSLIPQSTKAWILEHSLIVLTTLGIINLFLYILSHLETISKKDRKLYNNICIDVFDKYITPRRQFSDNNFRVSLFLVTGNIYLSNEFPWITRGKILQLVGRQITTQSQAKTRIKFYPSQGCAGISYSSGMIVHMQIDEFDANKPRKYLADSIDKFNLSQHQVNKLNEKYCSFIGVPLKYFQSRSIRAVLVIDCKQKDKLNEDLARRIEAHMSRYSVFFEEKEPQP